MSFKTPGVIKMFKHWQFEHLFEKNVQDSFHFIALLGRLLNVPKENIEQIDPLWAINFFSKMFFQISILYKSYKIFQCV